MRINVVPINEIKINYTMILPIIDYSYNITYDFFLCVSVCGGSSSGCYVTSGAQPVWHQLGPA